MCCASFTDLLGWARTGHQSVPWAEVWSRETRGSTAGGLWTQSPGNPIRTPQRCRTSSGDGRPACFGQNHQNQNSRIRLCKSYGSSPAVDDGVKNVAPAGDVQGDLPPNHSLAQIFEVKIRGTRKFVVVHCSFQALVWTVDVHVEGICRIHSDRNKDAPLHSAHCS